jgi:hypothetical protein
MNEEDARGDMEAERVHLISEIPYLASDTLRTNTRGHSSHWECLIIIFLYSP